MAKFSLGGGEGEGSSGPRAKRQRPCSPPVSSGPMEIVYEEDSDEEEEEEEDTSDESEEEEEEEEEEAIQEPQPQPQLQIQPTPLPSRPPQRQPEPEDDGGSPMVFRRNPPPPQHRSLEVSRVPVSTSPVGPSRNGAFEPLSVSFTDPEVLDCSICCEPLTIPVFQCENGHIACSSCCRKLAHKCPSCFMPIGYNRCRAIEKVLDSLKVRCPNEKYGCKESVYYSKKFEHDKSCSHAPCSCPLSGCIYQGSSKQLYLHCKSKHLRDMTIFQYNTSFPLLFTVNDKFRVLQEEKEGVVFTLNNRVDFVGNTVTLSCMGASSPKEGYFYELTAKAEGSNIRFQSSTRNVQSRVDNPPSVGFLLVPNDFFGSYGQIVLDVCIWRPGSSPPTTSLFGGFIQCK